MEIICMEKQTFDELVVRLSMIEKKVTGICSQTKDAGLKNGWTIRMYAGFSEYPREHFRYIARKDCCLSPGSRTSFSTNRKMYKACWNQVITHKKKAMSYNLINRKDPRIDTIFKGLENMERMIDAIRTAPRPAFHGDYFLTDEELSKLLKVSRRTLQEYRTLSVIPYYLIQGKALYKESDIKKVLDDAYKRCREEQRWV